jgi:hypothetical protein
MDITGKDLKRVASGVVESLASKVPGIGEAIAGWDAYKKSLFERNVNKVFQLLQEKVDNLEDFARYGWIKTQEGEQFVRKVFDASFDEQLQDKQDFFINALVNGVNNQTTTQLEKLKFIGILRHLSQSALIVLAEIHNIFKDQVRGPGRKTDPTQSYPLVDAGDIAEKLSDKYDPYLVTSAISEMESHGLFSRTGEWIQDPVTKRMRAGGGFSTSQCYTDFAARFVEFISEPSKKYVAQNVAQLNKSYKLNKLTT